MTSFKKTKIEAELNGKFSNTKRGKYDYVPSMLYVKYRWICERLAQYVFDFFRIYHFTMHIWTDMPELAIYNAMSDQGLHCLLLIHLNLDTPVASKMNGRAAAVTSPHIPRSSPPCALYFNSVQNAFYFLSDHWVHSGHFENQNTG